MENQSTIVLKELYEIFRVEEGIPLFLEDHLNRLFAGAQKSGIQLNVSRKSIKEYIYNNLSIENASEGNVRLSFYFNPENGNVRNFEGRFVPHNYPSKDQYRIGIRCSLLHSERIHPETKIANTELRKHADEIIQKQKVFEVLLVNHNGLIIEGSRSNVFFIQNNTLITASDNLVLPGIIRQKTIELCEELKIPLNIRCLHYADELKQAEGAFITGTSPRILPINTINDLTLNPNHKLIQLLIEKLKEKISEYIKTNKK